MASAYNIIGQRFGKLVVVSRAENNHKGNTMWNCKCDCGKEKIALGYDLTHNRTVSCGCKNVGTISKKRINRVGMKYGKLTVISLNEEKSTNKVLVWNCVCDCGNTFIARGSNLQSGKATHCGCTKKKPYNFIDITGRKFGKLTVVEINEKTKRGYTWNCVCDCGNTKIANGRNLQDGKTKSCGCLERANRARLNNTVHNFSKTRLYACWSGMFRRCSPKYHGRKSYYDKGIKVCEEWKDFVVFKDWAFKNGYNDKLTLDRLDNSKGYSPENCRWATMKEQQNNKTDNVYIEYLGKTQTLKQWCDELDINYRMVLARKRRGWEVPRLFEYKHKKQYE